LRPVGRTMVVTLGNSLRSDDGVGPFIASKTAFTGPNRKILNGETVPENTVKEIVGWRPAKLILIDAADFGGAPGDLKIIPLENIRKYAALSTHDFPLDVTYSVVREKTGCKITVLGVQIKTAEFGEVLSEEVEKSALKIIEYFNAVE